ncbi:MAG: flagellar assembly protein FliH [Treponema sp.]|nr:flagellar assembly protein FliH [Treponema sp.]
MAKQVFRPNEIKTKDIEKKFSLPLIHDYAPPPVEEEVEEEVYDGPTADDLRKEAEAFKQGWEIEKQHMLEEAQKSADEIVKKAEEAAFEEVKRQTDQAQVIKADAEREAADILEKARTEAAQIVQEAREEEAKLKSTASETGYAEGHDEGYKQGAEEVERLIQRLHKMIESIMVRREEILKETEQQIVELVILISRKVVKVISETQKTTIMSNVLAALKKVRARGSVILRVNVEDLKLTSANAGEFVKRIENVEGITVMEDSTVDKGGCIVETDFGAIDARISSQLGELENKILEVSPVKSITKVPGTVE